MVGKKRVIGMVFLLLFVASFWTSVASKASVKESNDDTKTMTQTYAEKLVGDEVGDIQTILDENSSEHMSFFDMVCQLLSGKYPFSAQGIKMMVKNCVKEYYKSDLNVWKKCLMLAIFSALFGALTQLLSYEQVGQNADFVVRALVGTILVSVVNPLLSSAEEMLSLVIDFMEALMPVFFMSSLAANGSATASAGYEIVLLVIGLVNVLMSRILLPVIRLYFYSSIINWLFADGKMGNFTEMLEVVIRWGIKGALGVVTGMNAIEGLLLPAIQKVKQNAILKTGEAIPIIGDVASGGAETLFAVFSLIRNAVGIAGCIVIVVMCLAPIIRLLVFHFVFRLEAAVVQPMGEDIMGKCFVCVAKTAGFLLRMELACILLFLVTILILSYAMSM
ncbi:MAG: stage III sporulation protein AE [Lachnospiraceae bacterium]|nr:stage III sporulation protein AE [Lachnospiraceae bacterium]